MLLLIPSDNFCLLNEMFNPFICHININIVGVNLSVLSNSLRPHGLQPASLPQSNINIVGFKSTILLVVFYLFQMLFVPVSFFSCLLWIILRFLNSYFYNHPILFSLLVVTSLWFSCFVASLGHCLDFFFPEAPNI